VAHDEVVSSLALYRDYRGPGFAEHTIFWLPRLAVTREGDLLVAVTTDETRPADARPFPAPIAGTTAVPVTQFLEEGEGNLARRRTRGR